MMGTTSAITMQSLGKIVQRAQAVGAKMWCLSLCLLFVYRHDCRSAANSRYCFTHIPKIRFFAPQGRLVAPIQVKLCSTDGHRGSLGCAKFHVNRCRRVGMRRQNKFIKNFHFFGKAIPLTDLENFQGLLQYPTLVFQISYDSPHRLWSYCGEIARR